MTVDEPTDMPWGHLDPNSVALKVSPSQNFPIGVGGWNHKKRFDGIDRGLDFSYLITVVLISI